MWKKIVLGIIIGIVVLTVSTGGIYAYQKDSNSNNGANTQSKNSYGINSASCTEQYCTGSGKNISSENASKNKNGVCDPEDCLNQNCKIENNRYRYNNGNAYQNQNNFCYQNNSQNQYNSQNCLQNGKNSPQGNNIKNSYGKNK